jgi:hypothetical protein
MQHSFHSVPSLQHEEVLATPRMLCAAVVPNMLHCMRLRQNHSGMCTSRSAGWLLNSTSYILYMLLTAFPSCSAMLLLLLLLSTSCGTSHLLAKYQILNSTCT